jgi:hypothetical protein
MKLVFAVSIALVLAGCDTIGGIRYDFNSSSFGDRTRAVTQACEARMNAPALASLRGKVELFKSPADGTVPFPILTDTSMPDAGDQRAIGVWATAIDQCQAEARRLLGRIPVPPDVTQSEVDKLASYITDAWVTGSQLRVALYNGQISYADYATKRLAAAEDALKTASRYAQDTDEENDTHNLEEVETALEPFAAMM